MTWLREAINDNATGQASSVRIAVLMASTTLCISTLLLTVIAIWRIEVVPALTVFGGALATMAGGSYVAQKAEKMFGVKNEVA